MKMCWTFLAMFSNLFLRDSYLLASGFLLLAQYRAGTPPSPAPIGIKVSKAVVCMS
jgi:hypothetical protein